MHDAPVLPQTEVRHSADSLHWEELVQLDPTGIEVDAGGGEEVVVSA